MDGHRGRFPHRRRPPWPERLPRPLRLLFDLLLPAPCLACSGARAATAIGLCHPCAGRLTPVCRRLCLRCRVPLTPAARRTGRLCSACRLRADVFEGLQTVLEYRPPLDSVLHAFKYGRMPALAPALIDLCLPETLARLRDGEALVPVPLHRWRRWRRGFNQAELLAQALGRRLDRPVIALLRRRRGGPPQARLPLAERHARTRDLFVVRRALASSRPSRVVLVDDVVTSGATLEAAAVALRRAGVAEVIPFALARTPLESGACAPFAPPPIRPTN